MLPAAQRFSLRAHPHFFASARKHSFRWGSVFVFVEKSVSPVELSTTEKKTPLPHSSSPLCAAVIVRKARFRTSVQRHTVKRQFLALIGLVFRERVAELKKTASLPHSTLFAVVIPSQPLSPGNKQTITSDLASLLRL